LVLLNEIVACLDYDVIFVTKDGGDLVCDPFLHQIDVNPFDVDFLVKLGWELGRLESLLVNAERHHDRLTRLLVVVWSLNNVSVDVERKLAVVADGSSQLAARRIGGHLRSYVNARSMARAWTLNSLDTIIAGTLLNVLSC
jgi:hypothetical protein